MTTSTRRSRLVRLGTAVLALGVLFTCWNLARRSSQRTMTLATGVPGGTFCIVGQGIAEVLNAGRLSTKLRTTESGGGRQTLERLEKGEVQLALVSNDTPGNTDVRAVAPLYDEVLQVVVRGSVSDIASLRGKRISLGPRDSGTARASEVVLRHFGLGGEYEPVNHSFEQAEAAFARGEVDAVFCLAGLRTPLVARLLGRGDSHLLSLGDPNRNGSPLEGVRFDSPFLRPAVVPERTYGDSPAQAVGTVGTQAVLVVRADVPDDTVRELTRVLFDNRITLAEIPSAPVRLSEKFDPAEIHYPLHPGAEDWYRRYNPLFIQQWADVISLFVSLALIGWSVFAGARSWLQRRKKQKVDSLYAEVRRRTVALSRANSLESLHAIRAELRDLRNDAIEDLVKERLAADESFTIFQDYLRTEIQEVDAAILLRRGSPDYGHASVRPPPPAEPS